MATIQNTPIRNCFGDGYQQKLALSDGESYNISNTAVPNVFGGGYQQRITPTDNNGSAFDGYPLIGIIAGLVGVGLCVFLPWLLMHI